VRAGASTTEGAGCGSTTEEDFPREFVAFRALQRPKGDELPAYAGSSTRNVDKET
jgi:hypothetical protein